MGFPKQEEWIMTHENQFESTGDDGRRWFS